MMWASTSIQIIGNLIWFDWFIYVLKPISVFSNIIGFVKGTGKELIVIVLRNEFVLLADQ
jgi:hypothetical protein